MRIRALHHVCIQTEDYEASLRFYVELLGFERAKETPGFHGRAFNTWLRCPGAMIELQTPKEGTSLRTWSKMNAGPVHIALLVDNVQETYEHLKTNGWSRFKQKGDAEVYEAGGSLILKVLAPEGTEIEIRSNPGI